MNVKQGDRAFIVRVSPLDPSSFCAPVLVLRPGVPATYRAFPGNGPLPNWWVRSEKPFSTSNGVRTEFVVPDACLRPIRDDDDESLPTDVEKPIEHKAPAFA